MNTHYETLEFNRILEKLKEQCVSDQAKEVLAGLSPSLSEDSCKLKMTETTAARRLLDTAGSPPLPAMKNLEESLGLSQIGAMLIPEQLTAVARFAVACRRMAAYLLRGESQSKELAAYGRVMEDLGELQTEIERCVGEERVYDDASAALRGLRRKKESLEARIREKLNQILQSRKQLLTDHYITSRNGRFVLPVQRRFQSQFGGTVVDASGTGSTVFMEPSAVAGLQAEAALLAVEEDAETRRILYTLTAEVNDHAGPIRRNMELMVTLDALFAKAKLSAMMDACPVEIGGLRRLVIRRGRHPLLDAEACVPLDLEMGEGTAGVIITGPNTGGKTVAMKTAGLLSLMAQCGLHIPCAEGSYIAMHDGYWCDIGDNQSISQNLSTFSGHMTNVIHILERASRDSLVLLDELGGGTDPAEGMGIAIAVLEELRRRGCMFLATTHYSQVKEYAEAAEHVQSARMAFDRESLAPLYRLEMGKSGESCALHIAKRLGLAPDLLERARCEAYGGQESSGTDSPAMKTPPSRLRRVAPSKAENEPSAKFGMGDSVMILPERETGIVYHPADETGNVTVQIKGKKRAVRHNRLKLLVPAAELYPEDYDFSIVFDTVENRKAGHILGKRYDPDACVVHREGKGTNGAR